MLERSRKKRKDLNTLAKSIVDEATGGVTKHVAEDSVEVAKNPAAVELGRLRGLKGGKVRATRLTAARRREIAAKAAEERWGKTS